MRYNNKAVVVSKRNIHNVRIFIPEKVKRNNNVYVCPVVFEYATPQSTTSIYSPGSMVCLDVTFNTTTIVATSPFSANSIRMAMAMAFAIAPQEGKPVPSRSSGKISVSKTDYYSKVLKQ